MSKAPQYRGRFAPSPTGPLHLGSLVAAVASYLDARHHGGHWLVRIEDLDPPREVAGASDSILESLRAHGLHWDGAVSYQSQHSDAYDAALAQLDRAGLLFDCVCTRSTLGPGGSCGQRCHPEPGTAVARRIALTCDGQCTDLLLGLQAPDNLPDDVVLRRKDSLYAYALAVVVDDGQQGITHVIRGADLLDQTPLQIALHTCLGHAPPAFGHVPVLTNAEGQKLSKQTGARALDNGCAVDNLLRVLRMLGQPIPSATGNAPALLEAATPLWDRRRIPQTLMDPGSS